jgi:hypothetical protein
MRREAKDRFYFQEGLAMYLVPLPLIRRSGLLSIMILDLLAEVDHWGRIGRNFKA